MPLNKILKVHRAVAEHSGGMLLVPLDTISSETKSLDVIIEYRDALENPRRFIVDN